MSSKTYFDRYNSFRGNGSNAFIPTVTLPVSESDKYEVFKLGETNLDMFSEKYYLDSNYFFLITAANPEYGGIEHLIPDRSVIRIPYPLKTALERYVNAVKDYINDNDLE